MKLLLDANLFWRLVKRLSSTFPLVLHVTKSGLPIPANDRAIWDWALANDYIIVTNDEDFSNLYLMRGFPPKVVIIRRSNQTTDQIDALLTAAKTDIEALENATQYGLLEIY